MQSNKEFTHSKCIMTLHIIFYHKRDKSKVHTRPNKKRSNNKKKKKNSQRSTGKKVNTGHLWTKETKHKT